MATACQHAQNLSFMKGRDVSAISLRKTEMVIYSEGGHGSCRLYKEGKSGWKYWANSSNLSTKNMLSMMDQGVISAIVKEME